MSLLFFVHEPEQVILLTDTLATTFNGDPHLFTNKVWPVPHMRFVMAGTGVAALHEAWYRRLNTTLLARDIDMVANHTPSILRELWKELAHDYGDIVNATATVYHFGIPEGDEHFVRYAFRSTDDFEAERSAEYGPGIKPVPIDPELFDKHNDLVEIGSAIRAEQDALPKSERTHIGGELVVTKIDRNGLYTGVLHRFDDYDDMWQAMNYGLGAA